MHTYLLSPLPEEQKRCIERSFLFLFEFLKHIQFILELLMLKEGLKWGGGVLRPPYLFFFSYVITFGTNGCLRRYIHNRHMTVLLGHTCFSSRVCCVQCVTPLLLSRSSFDLLSIRNAEIKSVCFPRQWHRSINSSVRLQEMTWSTRP